MEAYFPCRLRERVVTQETTRRDGSMCAKRGHDRVISMMSRSSWLVISKPTGSPSNNGSGSCKGFVMRLYIGTSVEKISLLCAKFDFRRSTLRRTQDAPSELPT
jgi:hypothetical protein